MNEITIENTQVQIVEHKGERVLTSAQLAQVYKCEPGNIKKNFNDNKERFIEGKHYFKLEGEDLRELKNRVTNSDLVGKNANILYLWTRRGASRHCKMLGTDEAWEMFDSLEENYFNPQPLVPSYMIEDAAERARRWADEQEVVRREIGILAAETAKQAQIIGELKPKADYTDRILQNKGLVPITAIAKDYGMSGSAMNKMLHDFKIIYKMGNQWLLYSKYHAKGYTHSETIDFNHKDGRPDVAMNTKWTQKGRLFLYDVLKEHGVLPVIEREATA